MSMPEYDGGKVHVAHIRNIASFGSPPLHNGGFTIAHVYHPDDGMYVFTVAKCHKVDNYTKKRGVEVALNRMNKGKVFQIPAQEPGIAKAIIDTGNTASFEEWFKNNVCEYSFKEFLSLVQKHNHMLKIVAASKKTKKKK